MPKTISSRTFSPKEQTSASDRYSQDWTAACCLFFPLMLLIWFALDHSWPQWDAASHIMDALKYTELLRHPRVFSGNWLMEFLTVNYGYPLTLHAFNGLLKLIFGPWRWVDALSAIFFSLLLSIATYKVGKLVTQSRLASCLGVLIINSYPLVAGLSHTTMLDFPHLSLYTVAIWCFLRWQELPSWKNTALNALATMLDATSKQIASLFLVAPYLIGVVAAIRLRSALRFWQLSISAFLSAVGLAAWILPNLKANKEWMTAVHAQEPFQANALERISHHLCSYLSSAWPCMTPLLTVAFCLSMAYLCAHSRERQRFKTLLASAAVGLVLMSTMSCNTPEPRYVMPVLLTTALITAWALAHVARTKGLMGRMIAVIVPLAAIVQAILFSFTPYPLRLEHQTASPMPSWSRSGQAYMLGAPEPPGDRWGQEWVIDTISTEQRGRPCWLLVLPNTSKVSVHPLQLISIYKNAKISVATTRVWSMDGDSVEFSATKLNYFDWVLIKNGDQGVALAGKESTFAYRQTKDFVTRSGTFELSAFRSLPDGSTLFLYRKKV